MVQLKSIVGGQWEPQNFGRPNSLLKLCFLFLLASYRLAEGAEQDSLCYLEDGGSTLR